MWNDLEAGQAKQDPRAIELEKQRQYLTQAVDAFNEDDKLAPIHKHLRGVLEGSSYAPGRDPVEVAFCEGQRTLARFLLGGTK